MEDDMAKVAVLGYGTVGSGVVEILNTNADSILKKAGQSIEVKSVLDLRDFPEDPIQEKIVHDIDLIINDDDIDVVVEVMGGVEPAFTFVKRALEAGVCVHLTRHLLQLMEQSFLPWQRNEILTLCLKLL
jgi:homoserine dehydrogenase